MNRARAAANAVKCLANLRTIGQACLLRAGEHDGYMAFGPSSYHPAGSTPTGLSDPSQRRYAYYKDGGNGLRAMPLVGALAPYLGQRKVRDDSRANMEQDLAEGAARDVFTCPSQVEAVQCRMVNGSPLGPLLYSSYAFNEGVFGDSMPTFYPKVRLRGRLAAVRRPTENALFFDGLPRTSYADLMIMTSPYKPGQTLYDASFSAGDGIVDPKRHRLAMMNVLYADMHAETVPATEGGTKTVGLTLGF